MINNSKALINTIVLNLSVALVYALCCYLASQYMIRTTLSVTIWPATGIGIGCVFVWGARVIPGIVLAELINAFVLYKVHQSFGWHMATLYDVLLYLTNIFRPLFAGFLARHIAGVSPLLIDLPKILRFFVVAAVLPCLFSTVIFACLLTLAGYYTVDDFLIKGTVWYISDLMSVLIFTPVVLSFFALPRSVWKPRIFSVGMPILIGFMLVFLLFHSFKGHEEKRINQMVKTHISYIVGIAQEQQLNISQLEAYLERQSESLKLDFYKIQLEEKVGGEFVNKYTSQEVLTDRYMHFVNSSNFTINSKDYRIVMTPTNAYFTLESSWGLWLTLFIAVSFVGIVGIGMLTMTGRQWITAREVEERTGQLAFINSELAERNKNYKKIIESQPVIFWKVDLQQDKVTYVSREAEAILGYHVKSWLTELHFFTRIIHPDDVHLVKDVIHKKEVDGEHTEVEYRIKHANGQYRWFRDYIHLASNSDESIEVMGMLVDITDRKSDTEKIQHLAFHDSLTQLPNRQKFQNELLELIYKAQENKRFGAVLFLDMDRFKVLNDALGHHFGDGLLLKVAGRLRDYEDDFKVISRFGGDEFVLATDCEFESQNDAAVQVIMLAEEIISHLAKPYKINEHSHVCTVSLGITIYPTSNSTVNDIIRQADVAMYRSKEQGRNQVTIYHESMKKDNDKMLFVEQVLRSAVTNDNFILKYQPIVDNNRNVVCFESLIRIFNEQQTIFPDEFIPVAEDTDLIQSVGRWVISHACLKIMDCQYNISVNVSSKQFHQQGFIMYIDQMLKRFNIQQGRLVVELTEGVVVGNINEIQYKFDRLKEMGVLIAIDDFGTGYSSLEYLRQLPIDYLKIDKSFVADLGKDESALVIIETIISMAQHLNLQTVAEGVETEEQFGILKGIGCSLFQGYLFGKPGDLINLQEHHLSNSEVIG
ncbi:MAG: EAL domain-containing protein [Xanthomonadales bacterium]|nr:EAL domain-containing protein [Xanthomonadales bacterium]